MEKELTETSFSNNIDFCKNSLLFEKYPRFMPETCVKIR